MPKEEKDRMGTKQCFKCKEIKSITEFTQCKNGKNKGDYYSYCKECFKKYYQIYIKKYLKTHPWVMHYICSHTRCHQSSNINHNRYKNLKFNMTPTNFKELWFRDKAYLLKRPSIHRKDNEKGYIKSNCCFIELSENIRLGNLGRKLRWTLDKKEALMKITNTSKKPRPEWLMGGNPKGIEAQEAEGQRELCNSSQLPKTDGYKDVKLEYEKLGIKIIGETKDDDIWYDVILPEDWKIEPTNHKMWSKLLNNKRKEIGDIFYKAAFYDRSCHIHLKET